MDGVGVVVSKSYSTKSAMPHITPTQATIIQQVMKTREFIRYEQVVVSINGGAQSALTPIYYSPHYR